MSPKIRLFVATFRRILEVFTLRGLWRKFWAHFHDLCIQKWSCFLRSSDAFWRFSPCEVYKKRFMAHYHDFASKNEAVCREVQPDFGSFFRASFIKKFWAHFLDFCVQKWSCLLLRSGGFWKLSLSQVYEESSGRIFTINASKNEAVCCEVQTHFWSSLPARFTESFGRIFTIYVSKNEVVSCEVQTHFGSFHLARFIKKFWAHYHDLYVHKRSCLPSSSGGFWKFFHASFIKKLWCIFSIFASKNEAVCCWVQTHFGSSLPASFAEEVLGALSPFMRLKMKLFAVKFRRILELLCLQGLQKKFMAYYHDLCVQKWSCLLLSSDAFWKFPAFKVYKKISGCIFSIYASKSEAVCREVRADLEVFSMQAL